MVEGMRIFAKEASRFDILLCRMVYMLLIRPTLANDTKKLEAEFIHGHRDGAIVFYISICDEKGEKRSLKDEDRSGWGPY